MTETLLSAVREQLLLDGNIAVLAPRRSRRHRLARGVAAHAADPDNTTSWYANI